MARDNSGIVIAALPSAGNFIILAALSGERKFLPAQMAGEAAAVGDLKCGGDGFHLVGAHEVVPVNGHRKFEVGTGADMPRDSKHLAETAQFYVTNRREQRDDVLDPLARLDLVRQFEQDAGGTDIDCFAAALYREAANLSDQYWQSQSVSLCTSLIQASNLRDERQDRNG
jgi:hypothetical protein